MTEGRSYIVAAYDVATARKAARVQAGRESHPTPEASILWAERIGTAASGAGIFEIVIAVGRKGDQS